MTRGKGHKTKFGKYLHSPLFKVKESFRALPVTMDTRLCDEHHNKRCPVYETQHRASTFADIFV